jgi:uncharacterized integral membrane protein
MRTKTIIVILFVALIIVFSLQNAVVIDVNFLFWKVSMSRVLIILGSFVIGVLVGLLVSLKRRISSKI